MTYTKVWRVKSSNEIGIMPITIYRNLIQISYISRIDGELHYQCSLSEIFKIIKKYETLNKY